MLADTNVGAYRLVRLIGEGGMGSVWLAEHVAMGRRAAVKLLHPELCVRDDLVRRFFNEARAAAAIADPGIVQIFDFGRQPNGHAYIAMELLEGEPLDRRLQRAGCLPVLDALRIVRQVATTLGVAHACGIVHRDLKPENIYLVRDAEVAGGERAKLLDFGIAKLGERAGVKTQTNALMGTPVYMSPEQCRGAGLVDERSDVYSLGCVLFALIAGRPPFVDAGAGELIVRHVTEPAPRITTFAPHVQANVEALIARCLEKDPERRFRCGGELAAALGMLVSSISSSQLGGGQVRRQASAPIASETTLGGAASETSGAHPIRRRSAWLAACAVAAVTAATAVLAMRDTAVPAALPDASVAAGPPDAAALDASQRVTHVTVDAPPPPATVTIRIDSQPPGAVVFVDDERHPRGKTPYTFELERDAPAFELRLVRAGFETHMQRVEPDGDRAIVVALQRRAATVRTADPDELLKPNFSTKRGGQ